MQSPLKQNAKDLEKELAWLSKVIDTRFKLLFTPSAGQQSIFDITPPDLTKSTSLYAKVIQHHQMSFAERLCLIVALASTIKPQLFDRFLTKNPSYNQRYTEFGGISPENGTGFLPTGETIMFLLGGNDLETRFSIQLLFESNHFFAKNNILESDNNVSGSSILKTPLHLSKEYLNHFTTGETSQAGKFSNEFPAQQIETSLNWDDLALPHNTINEIQEIQSWIQHGKTLLTDWQLASRIRSGYRVLFHGPPGTGKTLAATLLGKSSGYDVYKVNLSTLVSKYIGETEKNIAQIFDRAEDKNWILFFDEADALFGKRTEVNDSHDRYANQEVSYLLQRMESFPGIVILALNQNPHLDEAFMRRFDSIIHFPIPGPRERLIIWQKGLPAIAKLEQSIRLEDLARRFELSGKAIMNVVRSASLRAIERDDHLITVADIFQGIRKEYRKEGRKRL